MSDVLIWTPSISGQKLHLGNPKKREWVSYKGGECMKCTYDACVQSLTFHHIDPKTKRFALTTGSDESKYIKKRAIQMAPREIYEELDKCALLCHNCHYELHAGYWSIKQIQKQLRMKQVEFSI